MENDRFIVNKKKDSIIDKIGEDDLRQTTNNYGMLDKSGRILIPTVYDWIKFIDKDMISVSDYKNNKEAVFDVNGKQITAFNYMVIGQFYDGYSTVRKGEQSGYIDKNGKEFLMGKYEIIYPFYHGKAIVNKKRGSNNFLMINTKGKVVRTINADYDELKRILKNENLEKMIGEFRSINQDE